MQDHGRPDDRTFRISWAGRSAQKTRRTNVQRKISISAFLLYALKFFHELLTPSNGGDTNIARGMLRMSTSLDIPLTRPLRMLETKGAAYGHKALSKTGRTSNPTPRLLRCFYSPEKSCSTPLASLVSTSAPPKRGSEGSAYRISPKGEAVRLPKLIEQLGLSSRRENKE